MSDLLLVSIQDVSLDMVIQYRFQGILSPDSARPRLCQVKRIVATRENLVVNCNNQRSEKKN